MRVPFTKMQGAGNDFVVLDATAAPLAGVVLAPAQLRRLADRRLGVGADQVLQVERPSPEEAGAGIDFRYRIWNGASGDEVEHCGNGARCFVRFVHQRGLSRQRTLHVATVNRRLVLQLESDGGVTVDMQSPRFEPAALPFEVQGLPVRAEGRASMYTLDVQDAVAGAPPELTPVSMGNPHAVLRVADVDAAPVASLGPRIERHRRFARGVNVGFLQVVSRAEVRLRVFERDAGETLACGSGACAAVAAGIRAGWLEAGAPVRVHTRGGLLVLRWSGEESGDGAGVFMTGPAETVFEGEIDL